MPVMEKTNPYYPIPPPPLSEFYATKHTRKDIVTSITSSSNQAEAEREILVINGEVASVDGAYDTKPPHAKLAAPPTTPLMAMPPTYMDADYVPPLAIYHICRICLRPRSPRYHREHPIPIDGVPPPPGICRRCRVTTVEDTKNVDLVIESRSNQVKFGFFTPFMKDDDIVSQGEMKRIRVEQYLKGRGRGEVTIERRSRNPKKSARLDQFRSDRKSESRKGVAYGHVRVVKEELDDDEDESEEESDEKTERRVVYTSWDATGSGRDERVAERSKRSKIVTAKAQAQPAERLASASASAKAVKSTNMRKLDSAAASISTQSSSRTSTSGSTSIPAAAEVRNTRPERTESEIRQIAREEVDRYARTMLKQIHSESDVRRISREEVERYRAAERKLEGHPDAYTHGRLVPVVPIERRLEIESDAPAPTPWSKPTKDHSVVSKDNAEKTSKPWSEHETVEVSVSARSSHRKSGQCPPGIGTQVDHTSRDEAPPRTQQTGSRGLQDRFGPCWGFDQPVETSAKVSKRTGVKSESEEQHSSRSAQNRNNHSTKDVGDATWNHRSEQHSEGPGWRRELSVEGRDSIHISQRGNTEERASTQRPPSFARSYPAANIDPPSVKLREVYDIVQQSNPPRWSSRAEPYAVRAQHHSRKADENVIEVIEEIEIPPRSKVVSSRHSDKESRPSSPPQQQQPQQGFLRTTEKVYGQRHERAQPESSIKPGSERQTVWSRSSKPTDRDYWYDEATVRTAETWRTESGQQSRKNGGSQGQMHQTAPQKSNSAQRTLTEDDESLESDKTRWPKDQRKSNDPDRDGWSIPSAVRSGRPLPDPNRDTMPDEESSTALPNRSARSGIAKTPRHNKTVHDYEYTQRAVTPADRPRGWRPAGREEVFEEETLYWRDPKGRDFSPQ